MNLEKFYGDMKKVLAYFNLDWNEKDEVIVEVVHNGVQFTHCGESVVVVMNNAEG